jgi:FkbM family methyltransferase
MSQLPDSVSAKPRRYDPLRRLRRLLSFIDWVDVERVAGLIAKLEASQRSIQASQDAIRKQLQTNAEVSVAPRLISPLEFASSDRFELENRCRAMTNPVYVGGHTALCRILGCYKLFVDTSDVGFGSHVVLDGYWETWITIFVARQLKPGMVVIDVGANYGYYTIFFGALVGDTGHVYAFEPNPNILPKLHRSVELNGFTDRTTIIGAAAGSVHGGEGMLYASRDEPKNGTMISFPEAIGSEPRQVHKVPLATVDESIAPASRVDFVKIDAEGAEEAVIEGMMGILNRDKPGLLLEFNAVRYREPRVFLGKLGTIYSRTCYIDYEGNGIPATVDQIVTERWGEDWLLYFD